MWPKAIYKLSTDNLFHSLSYRVHITHLALYNLMVGRRSPAGRVRVAKEGGEKKEYFRWNEDICGFIRTHWNKLMPDRKRTQSWRSTVAGTLSVNCPAVFQSGKSPLSCLLYQ